MKCWFEALPHLEMASRGCIKGLLESAVRTKGEEMNTETRTPRAGAGPRAEGTWLDVARSKPTQGRRHNMSAIQEIREAFGQSGGANGEPTTIDKILGIGMSPRSIVRRYAGLSRKAVERHRDKRHYGTTANDKRSST